MIAIQRSEEPEVLKTKGKNQRRALCANYTRYQADYDNGTRKFNFDSNIYADSSVKEALKTMQHDKCCFCESKISHISYGDVEHFRPKAGYKQNEQDSLHKPGYYWLAYEWDNLLLCCQLCNQRHKGNLFPLENPHSRAINHHYTLADEAPLLINPTVQNPENFIRFREEKPYAINDNISGRNAIALLALDRKELNEQRLKHYELIQTLKDMIESVKEYPDDLVLQENAQKAQRIINERMQPQAEYSAMIKAALDNAIEI